jgi:hypothetical protein
MFSVTCAFVASHLWLLITRARRFSLIRVRKRVRICLETLRLNEGSRLTCALDDWAAGLLDRHVRWSSMVVIVNGQRHFRSGGQFVSLPTDN